MIKFGSNLLVGKDGRIDESFIGIIASRVSAAVKAGHGITIVSSGAKAGGYGILKTKGIALSEKQALCAVGQIELMRIYSENFQKIGIQIAQLLLTRDDFSNRKRFLNMINTVSSLKKFGVIPIINENDTVATDEIKVGDNDTLSAYVAIGVMADMLILFTVVDGVLNEHGEVINEFGKDEKMAKIEGTKWGTGGITTKIKAANVASSAGVKTIIANGKTNDLLEIIEGKRTGTLFNPSLRPNAKKTWIGLMTKPSGRLYIDEGAAKAILDGKSLLPIGIKNFEGNFSKGDTVEIFDENRIIAIGVVNYSNDTLSKILSMGNNGYEICHADKITRK